MPRLPLKKLLLSRVELEVHQNRNQDSEQYPAQKTGAERIDLFQEGQSLPGEITQVGMTMFATGGRGGDCLTAERTATGFFGE